MKRYLIIISGLIFCWQIIWIFSSDDGPVSSEKPAAHIPDFSLPSLSEPSQSIIRSDLKDQNIRIINFFASWCGPCRIEHPLLLELEQKGLPILGINFQDRQNSALLFLKNIGNPYKLTAWDKTGKLGARWGIMSIPQTFVIDEQGKILYHKSGRLHSDDITNHILPLLQGSKPNSL